MVSSHRILGRLALVFFGPGLVAALLGAAALAGCGQKGPLFLPVPPVLPASNPVAAPAVSVPASPASASQ